ncbi:hypothetical protein VOLCADRAFT_96388 [Volvox carteri f. nagariensis]|uniref:Inositol polyphosphate multikinase n=1 Tax=Volvox carteri f. nagariensis TaxID=3068 RepID=D8U9Z6_VOLCA|nr:uncharacterized protein VOLCADRAFT_96388 [Volvox carteri f. nagariensis]EFJ43499.1 hypothetical protein VOLCADRAFT_96388 [Volvox carteri f. nagariensis]|eukprot:XP_002955428.1 hypothetical protein VOLCADRAFT_96388 [Volvox carteri f. nagariensis]
MEILEASQVPDLKPCEHQAGGHFSVVQDDVRSGREASIYEAIFSDNDDGNVRREDMVAFRPLVPRYFGVIVDGDKKLLALEDTCRSYRRPCVLDAKMGLTTIYEWAEERYKAKNATKDLVTTQSTLGFRVTGFKVWQSDREEYFVADRLYGKDLTAQTMPAAFAKFGSNAGGITPRDVYRGPHGAVAKIRALQSWFETQRSLLFFAASVLIVYEGAATRPEEVNVAVRFIDFAHTFPSGGKRDDNVLAGIKILADMLENVGSQAEAQGGMGES